MRGTAIRTGALGLVVGFSFGLTTLAAAFGDYGLALGSVRADTASHLSANDARDPYQPAFANLDLRIVANAAADARVNDPVHDSEAALPGVLVRRPSGVNAATPSDAKPLVEPSPAAGPDATSTQGGGEPSPVPAATVTPASPEVETSWIPPLAGNGTIPAVPTVQSSGAPASSTPPPASTPEPSSETGDGTAPAGGGSGPSAPAPSRGGSTSGSGDRSGSGGSGTGGDGNGRRHGSEGSDNGDNGGGGGHGSGSGHKKGQ